MTKLAAEAPPTSPDLATLVAEYESAPAGLARLAIYLSAIRGGHSQAAWNAARIREARPGCIKLADREAGQ